MPIQTRLPDSLSNWNTAAFGQRLKAFFTEIMICCGCGDNPMPANAYSEMQITIDTTTAEATFNIRCP